MATPQKPRSKSAAQRLADAMASDPFFTPDANIDWSGCPSLVGLPQDESFLDDRFAPLSGSGDEHAMRGGDTRQGLRQFVETESTRVTAPNAVNLGKGIVGKVAHNGRRYICVFTVEGKVFQTKGTVYDDCVMQACQFVFNRKPDIRELTSQEKQLVILTAQGGEGLEAAQKYVEFSCPGASEQQLMSDPKYRRVFDEAAWYGWAYSNNDYSLSDKEFPRYLKRFAQGKMLSLALISSAFAAYKNELAAQQRAALLNPQPQPEREPNAADIVAGLETMSDEQIKAQLNRVTRSRAAR